MPPVSQGNLFVKGFDLRQQTTGLRRLRQMEIKSVSVCLYTEQASCGSASRHSGSSSARPLFVTSVCLETHIKPHQFSGEYFLPYIGHGGV